MLTILLTTALYFAYYRALSRAFAMASVARVFGSTAAISKKKLSISAFSFRLNGNSMDNEGNFPRKTGKCHGLSRNDPEMSWYCA